MRDEIEEITCECGKKFWATRRYIKKTNGKGLCYQCFNDKEPLLMEDDASEPQNYIEPEPMEGLA